MNLPRLIPYCIQLLSRHRYRYSVFHRMKCFNWTITSVNLVQFKWIPPIDRRFSTSSSNADMRGTPKCFGSNSVAIDDTDKSRRFATDAKQFSEEVSTADSSESEDVSAKSQLSQESDGQEVDEYLTLEQWKMLKEEWSLRHHNPTGGLEDPLLFESRTMARLCKGELYQKGRSLMEFVRQRRQPLSYPLMNAYLYLCVNEEDHDELFAVYDWFKSNQPVLDAGVLSNLMRGFCRTSRWRESLQFMRDIQRIGIPSSRNYHAILCAACDHAQDDLVEEILRDMYGYGIVAQERTWLKLLQTLNCQTGDSNVRDRRSNIVTDLLEYTRSKRTYPSTAVGTELKKWFMGKKDEVWNVSMATVTTGGKCRSCHGQMESLDLRKEDFVNLREQIIEKVIKGRDVYKKTRPEELAAFMDFVDESKYDVIIDGLNVAHIKQNRQPSKMLRQFVVYLAQECGLKCLVLGRQHMLQHSNMWNRHHMEAVQDLTDCFFTENISEDDPFVLYATLHSGPKAYYVSRDMLRDHKALLDQPTHVAFIKWQRAHQMYPVDFKGGRAIFKPKVVHDTVAQYGDSTWHIPLDDGRPRFSYQVPFDWLCAKRIK